MIDVENLFKEIREIKITNKTTIKDVKDKFYALMRKYKVKTPLNNEIWKTSEELISSMVKTKLYFSFMVDKTPKDLIQHENKENSELKEFDTKRISKINFNSKKIKNAINKLKKENEEILKASKPDWSKMNVRFDV